MWQNRTHPRLLHPITTLHKSLFDTLKGVPALKNSQLNGCVSPLCSGERVELWHSPSHSAPGRVWWFQLCPLSFCHRTLYLDFSTLGHVHGDHSTSEHRSLSLSSSKIILRFISFYVYSYYVYMHTTHVPGTQRDQKRHQISWELSNGWLETMFQLNLGPLQEPKCSWLLSYLSWSLYHSLFTTTQPHSSVMWPSSY